MSYLTNPLGKNVELVEKDKNGKTLQKARGKTLGSNPLHLKSPPPGFEPGYPSYEIVSVDGSQEVIEHRKMEPIFYVSDDLAVRRELLAAPASDK